MWLTVILSGLLYAVLGGAIAPLAGVAAKGRGSRGRRLVSLWVSTGIGVAAAIALGWFTPWFIERGFQPHAISAISALVGGAVVASFFTGKTKH